MQDGGSLPHGCMRSGCPPRAAYSHSASEGRRPPAHAQYARASSQETFTTGWSSFVQPSLKRGASGSSVPAAFEKAL